MRVFWCRQFLKPEVVQFHALQLGPAISTVGIFLLRNKIGWVRFTKYGEALILKHLQVENVANSRHKVQICVRLIITPCGNLKTISGSFYIPGAKWRGRKGRTRVTVKRDTPSHVLLSSQSLLKRWFPQLNESGVTRKLSDWKNSIYYPGLHSLFKWMLFFCGE